MVDWIPSKYQATELRSLPTESILGIRNWNTVVACNFSGNGFSESILFIRRALSLWFLCVTILENYDIFGVQHA